MLSAAINQKNALLKEVKSAKIADVSYRLQISVADKHCLKTEVDFLKASNNEHINNTCKLNEDFLAKASVNCDWWNESNPRLHLGSQIVIVDQMIRIEDLVALNMNYDGLISLHENELEAKTLKNEEMSLGMHQRNVALEDKSAEVLLLTSDST